MALAAWSFSSAQLVWWGGGSGHSGHWGHWAWGHVAAGHLAPVLLQESQEP